MLLLHKLYLFLVVRFSILPWKSRRASQKSIPLSSFFCCSDTYQISHIPTCCRSNSLFRSLHMRVSCKTRFRTPIMCLVCCTRSSTSVLCTSCFLMLLVHNLFCAYRDIILSFPWQRQSIDFLKFGLSPIILCFSLKQFLVFSVFLYLVLSVFVYNVLRFFSFGLYGRRMFGDRKSDIRTRWSIHLTRYFLLFSFKLSVSVSYILGLLRLG